MNAKRQLAMLALVAALLMTIAWSSTSSLSLVTAAAAAPVQQGDGDPPDDDDQPIGAQGSWFNGCDISILPKDTGQHPGYIRVEWDIIDADSNGQPEGVDLEITAGVNYWLGHSAFDSANKKTKLVQKNRTYTLELRGFETMGGPVTGQMKDGGLNPHKVFGYPTALEMDYFGGFATSPDVPRITVNQIDEKSGAMHVRFFGRTVNFTINEP